MAPVMPGVGGEEGGEHVNEMLRHNLGLAPSPAFHPTPAGGGETKEGMVVGMEGEMGLKRRTSSLGLLPPLMRPNDHHHHAAHHESPPPPLPPSRTQHAPRSHPSHPHSSGQKKQPEYSRLNNTLNFLARRTDGHEFKQARDADIFSWVLMNSDMFPRALAR